MAILKISASVLNGSPLRISGAAHSGLPMFSRPCAFVASTKLSPKSVNLQVTSACSSNPTICTTTTTKKIHFVQIQIQFKEITKRKTYLPAHLDS
jgi:hypothetical protein